MKVAPGAIAHLRRFAILPAHIKASGHKGYIQKGDVLAHIKKLNLAAVDLSKVSHTSKPTEAPKK
jgi:hypothetical protein